MPRAVIVATGDLQSLPAEVQDVANILSEAGWTVRLCIGADASRAGLARAADEGPATLAWVGAHADERGFGLADGVLSAGDLGLWLAQLGAAECVLNTCYSLEHVTAIQRVAAVGVACTIDPAGVDDRLAWTAGVVVAREYVEHGDMARAVAAAGNGYRYIPRGGRRGGRRGSGGQMNIDEQELLRQLVSAIKGDGFTGPGLLKQLAQQVSQQDAQAAALAQLSAQLSAFMTEHERFRQETREKFAALEKQKPVAMTERSIYIAIISVTAAAALLMLAMFILGGGLR